MNDKWPVQAMDHPHIIHYLDCKLERNELTVVMELAEHGDLAKPRRGAVSRGAPLGEAAA